MKELVKIVVTVPTQDANALRKVIGKVGAGKLGNYSYCSYSVIGIGRFLPGSNSHPAIGQVGQLEQVKEERIEVTCEREHMRDVVEAICTMHPYEEPAIDVYPLLSILD